MCNVGKRNPSFAKGINILDASSALKNRKLDKSCTSNPKSEVSDWTVPATRRFNGGGDDPAEFLVFRGSFQSIATRRLFHLVLSERFPACE